MTATDTRPTSTPFWRDLRVLRILAQVVAIAGAVALVWFLWNNLVNELRRQGITTDFGFLDQPTGIAIPGSDFDPSQPIGDMVIVGIRNTLALVVAGIPLVTVVGVLVGVARLSTNFLVERAASLFVETLRNIPPVLVIIFVSQAVLLQLPPLAAASTPAGLMVISNSRLAIPWFAAQERVGAFLVAIAGSLLVAAVVWIWRTGVNRRTGEPHHRLAWATGVVVLMGGAAYVALGGPVEVTRPVLEGRRITGGIATLAPFVAMLVGLVLYTASHVAEIVRGSILAVPRGQTEAANALALTGFQRMRFVVLPQAARIAIPPIINQYLNFTKNTSLGIAVGYSEITLLVFQTIGNANPAPQLILILMAVYLMFSLVISALVNVLNRRLQYVGA